MRNKALLAAGLFVLQNHGAFAHVTLAEPRADTGSDYLAQFHVGHGCGDSPTIALRVEIPAGIRTWQPQAKPGWTVGRAANAAIWQGGSAGAHVAETFAVRMHLPNVPGQLVFPATQTCESGVEHWSEVAQPGPNAPPLKRPAPVLTLASPDMGRPSSAADLVLKDGWMRSLPAGLPAGGYFTLHNSGSKDRVLTDAASPGCGMLMLHRSDDKGGMTAMNDVSEVNIPAGGTLKFAPGGYHLMCMDARLKIGSTVPVTLRFRDGATLQTQFAVRDASGK
jgi:copper(I)-binding protein